MKTPFYLKEIILRKQKEVENLIALTQGNPDHILNQILKQTQTPNKRFAKALQRADGQLAIIAEIKRASPSIGEISPHLDPVKLALSYVQGEASALSVLTDFEGFGGSLKDLQDITSKIPHIPILRKDFIFHPLQMAEAVLVGASAILLIVSVVGNHLKSLIREATRLGLETLVEVHNLEELEIAIAANCPIIGINHRNLSTFKVDLSLSKILRPLIPSSIITVAESGIHTSSLAVEMQELGYNAVLIGEALVRSKDPITFISQIKESCHES